MSKEFFLYVDSDYKLNASGAETTTEFTYNLGNLLPFKYNKYYVELVYIIIPHLYDDTTTEPVIRTYYEYWGEFYKVYLNFKFGQIYTNDAYVEIFADEIPKYTTTPYYDTTNNTLQEQYNLNKSAIVGRNGSKIIIDRPSSSTVKIILTNESNVDLYQRASVYNATTGTYDVSYLAPQQTKFLLKFTGIDENCNCK